MQHYSFFWYKLLSYDEKTKLLKTLLIPSLRILTIAPIAAAVASCGKVSVQKVTLNKSATSLYEGQEETLIATIYPEEAIDKSVTWSSSHQTIATVDQNGKIKAIAKGEANITVTTNDGNKTATCKVTVTKIVHVESVELNKHETTLDVGETEILTYSITPSTATDKSVTWSSSDENVITVQEGKITAKAEGTATITVTTTDGSKTDTCEVTVIKIVHVESVELNKKA